MKISLIFGQFLGAYKILIGLLILIFSFSPTRVTAQTEIPKKLLKNSLNDPLSEAYVNELLDSATYKDGGQNKEFSLLYCIEANNISSQIILNRETQIRLHTSLSKAFSGVGAHSYAINHSKIAISIIEKYKEEKFGLIWRYGRVGTLYLLQEQLDSALFFYRKALPFAIKNDDLLFIASSYNNLGIGFSKINIDSALYYFNYSKEILQLDNQSDSALMSSINDNLADIYFTNEDFKLAEPLYKWNLIFLQRHPNYRQRAQQAGIQLAYIYLKTNEYSKLQPMLVNLKANLGSKNYSQKRIISKIEADLSSKLGNKERELFCLNEEVKALELLQEETDRRQKVVSLKLNEYSLKKIQRQLELEKLETSTQKNLLELSEQKSINRLTWIWASVFSSILFIIILYLNHWKKIEVRKRQQEKLDNELAMKKRDLEDFALEIVQKQDWTDKLSERLLEIKNLDKEEVSLAVKSLFAEVKGTQIAEKQKKVFQKNIAEVNHSFFEKLQLQFGNLTKTERELAGLLRMELSNKEIAKLRNMEVNSVKRSRSRLRKKLNLSPETDIYSFLKSI